MAETWIKLRENARRNADGFIYECAKGHEWELKFTALEKLVEKDGSSINNTCPTCVDADPA